MGAQGPQRDSVSVEDVRAVRHPLRRGIGVPRCPLRDQPRSDRLEPGRKVARAPAQPAVAARGLVVLVQNGHGFSIAQDVARHLARIPTAVVHRRHAHRHEELAGQIRVVRQPGAALDDSGGGMIGRVAVAEARPGFELQRDLRHDARDVDRARARIAGKSGRLRDEPKVWNAGGVPEELVHPDVVPRCRPVGEILPDARVESDVATLGEPVYRRRGEHLCDRTQRVDEILGIAFVRTYGGRRSPEHDRDRPRAPMSRAMSVARASLG